MDCGYSSGTVDLLEDVLSRSPYPCVLDHKPPNHLYQRQWIGSVPWPLGPESERASVRFVLKRKNSFPFLDKPRMDCATETKTCT